MIKVLHESLHLARELVWKSRLLRVDCLAPATPPLATTIWKMLHKDREIIFSATVCGLVSFSCVTATYRWRDCGDNLKHARGLSCFRDKGVLSVRHKVNVRNTFRNDCVHIIIAVGCACDGNMSVILFASDSFLLFWKIISSDCFSYIKLFLELWLMWTLTHGWT